MRVDPNIQKLQVLIFGNSKELNNQTLLYGAKIAQKTSIKFTLGDS